MHGSGLLGSTLSERGRTNVGNFFRGGGNISTNIFDSLLSAISPMNSMRVISDGCGRSDSGRRLSGDDGGSGLSSVGVRECGERAVVVKGRASSAERGLLFGRFGTAIVSADGGIGISDLVFPKNDVTFVRNKSNSKE